MVLVLVLHDEMMMVVFFVEKWFWKKMLENLYIPRIMLQAWPQASKPHRVFGDSLKFNSTSGNHKKT